MFGFPHITYDLALEIANGAGFVLFVVLGLTLLAFLLPQIKERSWTVIWLTSGMIIVKIGLSITLGYRWLVTRCQNLNDGTDCKAIESDSWLLFAAVIIMAAGGLVILRVMSRPSWRPWSWLGALVLAIVLPTAYYTFDFLFPTDRSWGEPVQGYYRPELVALSIAIAVVGSYTSLELSRISLMVKNGRITWLLAASFVLGGSIWAMHFVGMLSYVLPGVPVTYDPWITALSLAVPIVVTAIGLVATAFDGRSPITILPSGVLIGIGIIAMHYTGMAAMEMPAVPAYNLHWVAFSIVVAITGAMVAVYLAMVDTTFWERVAGALAMGVVGISGLHYSAMLAFTCYKAKGAAPAVVMDGLTQGELAAIVGAISAAILAAFLTLTTLYRKRLQQ